MPAPSAAFILSMLNPYAGFNTGDSARTGIAAGQGMASARLGRDQLSQQRELAQVDDERARQYLQLQRDQFTTGQENFTKQNQAKAFAEFQDAIANGDVERARLAGAQLRQWGVDVEEYGGPGQGGPAAAPSAPSGAMGAMAMESPTAAVAQGRAVAAAEQTPESYDPGDAYGSRARQSAADQQTSDELDKLAEEATVDTGGPMSLMETPGMRPSPARTVDTPKVDAEDQAEAMGSRPAPARTSMLDEDAPAPAGEATPDQPLARGYRLNFGGKIIDIDPEMVLERQRERVTGVMAPILASATTPEEKRAALKATESASNAVGTLTPRQAVQLGLDIYQTEMDRHGRERRARIIGRNPGAGAGDGYGGVPDLTEDEKKRSLDVGKYANSIIERVLEKYNVKAVRDQIAQEKDILSKAASKDSLSQFASKLTLQKALMKGTLSDKDVARLESAPGQWLRLQQWVNNWTGEGRVPDDVLRQIREIAVKKAALLQQRLDEAGQAARDRIESDATLGTLTTPEELEQWKDSAYGAATGFYRKKRRAPARGGSAGRRPTKKSASQEADELLE